jgi:hypothetical protein
MAKILDTDSFVPLANSNGVFTQTLLNVEYSKDTSSKYFFDDCSDLIFTQKESQK